tara:strand:+ start:49 stop:981 length:933 start_codon:yes stop_codon:yes gene_type:complete
MNKNIKINLFFLLFIILVIFSLIQGYSCKYHLYKGVASQNFQVENYDYYHFDLNPHEIEKGINPRMKGFLSALISLFNDNSTNDSHFHSYSKIEPICSNYFKNYWSENGFIENLQVLFLFISIILLIKINLQTKIKFINFFLTFKVFFLIYYLGEEISWGQHFFEFKTPEILMSLNNQNETNLHNISNLFDQLPRGLVFIWCSLSIILVKIIEKKINFNSNLKKLIVPNIKLIYVSFFLLILSAPDIVIDKLNLHPGYFDHETNTNLSGAVNIYDVISLNFVRFSELQELVFCFYFLLYSIYLYKNKVMR